MTEPGPIVAALAETPLLEREQELRALDGLLSTGARASSRLVLIEGTAGIGKSRLIAELREHATYRNMRVLAAHGSDLEREFPFGVVRQLFEPLLAEAVDRKRFLAEAAAAAGPVFEELHPHASAFFDPDTSTRLREVKALYDPEDLFKGNHQVPPPSEGAHTSRERTFSRTDELAA